MQNELKQISLRWISIFSDSESKYVKYNKQSDFLSSHFDEPVGRVKIRHDSKKHTAILHTKTSNNMYLRKDIPGHRV